MYKPERLFLIVSNPTHLLVTPSLLRFPRRLIRPRVLVEARAVGSAQNAMSGPFPRPTLPRTRPTATILSFALTPAHCLQLDLQLPLVPLDPNQLNAPSRLPRVTIRLTRMSRTHMRNKYARKTCARATGTRTLKTTGTTHPMKISVKPGKKAKGEKGKLKSKANEREMIKLGAFKRTYKVTKRRAAPKIKCIHLTVDRLLIFWTAQTRFKLPEFADTAMLTDAFFNKSGQLLALSIAKSNAAEEAAAHALKLRVEHLETLNDAEREDFLVEMRHDTIKACAQVEEKVQKLRRDNIELKGALKNLEKENTQAIVDKDEGGEGGGTD
ncbi:hypothetical protein RhiLY_09905 [Ceratobasidium sp. AG-Ba]|nr:hypothetical protein RhiLY_09905 [Ceratobasidium sp. AG-Ba]